MTVFSLPAIVTDRATLKARAVATMESELPGWRLTPGTPEDAMFDAWAQVASEQAEVLLSQLVSVFRSLGPLFNVPPIPAIPATGTITVTMVDSVGYTLEPGEVTVGLRDANGQLQAFRLTTPIVIAAGKTEGTGTAEALEAGAVPNGLAGVTQLIESPASVSSASLATTGGGQDVEEDTIYLNRFAETLSLIKPGPVKAVDAATVARQVAGIGRATAVDLLNPSAAHGGEGGADETNVEKCVTVAITDANGVASDAGHIATVKALLEAGREPNFKWFVIKPLYMKVDVAVTVSAWPGYDLTIVKNEVKEALERFLSPANFGTDQSGIPARWTNISLLRKGDLYSAIESVRGVRWATALTFGKTGGALAETDLDLAAGTPIPSLPEVTGATYSITVNPST